MLYKLCRIMNRLPYEVERMDADQFWSLVAEFKIASDEWEAEHPKK